MKESSDERRQIDKSRYSIIAALIASFAGEMDDEGAVGGFLRPDLAVEACCEAMAALMAKTGGYQARKDRRALAEDIRKTVLRDLDAFVDQPDLLDAVFQPIGPHSPPAFALGARGTRH